MNSNPNGNDRTLTLVHAELVVGLLVVVAGLAFVFTQHAMIENSMVTNGTMTTASFTETVHVGRGAVDVTSDSPNIAYRYTVGQVTYNSSNIVSAGSEFYAIRPQAASALVNSYHEGSTVTVYYARGNPEKSFLLPQHSFIPHYLCVIFGLLIVADSLASGTILYFLWHLCVLSMGGPNNFLTFSTPERKLLPRVPDVFVWGGAIALCEVVILQYIGSVSGPVNILAPITGFVLFVCFAVYYRGAKKESPQTL
ncbi:hypothetical protein C440_16529 [Haloferax mucosum ATCC BAA-1512]|uniref:DUF3592 domain-containing protein n=1 Tax=Haloferax mucosum ATCC BAA-1512 TaxID=662479 RepID=M0I596_9EURY|nr:DUF3592 domain-containing protein [Haloferax mucosum]ELZ91936.1 hypothetical protein C440_16529 [Haloferax mucosum ATCC BAA-1512]